MKTVAFYTLGCKVNTYESEAMSLLFENEGYKIVDFHEKADIYIINTCTVTHLSDRKSRQMIRRAINLNPNALVVAVGCYSQVAPEEVSKIDGVDIVLGTRNKNEVLELVNKHIKGQKTVEISKVGTLNDTFNEMWVDKYEGRTRAFLKIQEGCNNFCSYCIIPYARGNISSRDFENIKDEASTLIQNGFKEIVLTGIHITSYGKDNKEQSLLDVILMLNDLKGLKRIRLSSLEPLYLDEKIISKLSNAEKLCPHFHLSLQSGCDSTLKRMNRKYTTNDYYNIVTNINNAFKDAAITTDVMVGFPGETDEEFENTYEFVNKIGFSQMHIFKYSRRKGTKAYDFPNQIDASVKELRSNRLIELASKMKKEYMLKYLGKTKEVLLEQKTDDGYLHGLTSNYIEVKVKGDQNLLGEIVQAELLEYKDGNLLGKLI